jgi:hypothetical protein
MGNISYRLGKSMSNDEVKNVIKGNADMMDSFDRMLKHLSVNEVDAAKTLTTIGPMLTMDPKAEKFVGKYSDMANMLVKRNYREPFVIPEKV